MTRTAEQIQTTEPNVTTAARAGLTPTQRWVLAATRIVVAFLFVSHGSMAFGAFGGVDGAGAAAPLGAWPTWYAGVLEVGAGGLVLLGLFTRTAAVVCSGVMAYAYFTVHQPMALLPLQNMGEQAALYCWIFLLIAALGPGAAALDGLLRRRASRSH